MFLFIWARPRFVRESRVYSGRRKVRRLVARLDFKRKQVAEIARPCKESFIPMIARPRHTIRRNALAIQAQYVRNAPVLCTHIHIWGSPPFHAPAATLSFLEFLYIIFCKFFCKIFYKSEMVVYYYCCIVQKSFICPFSSVLTHFICFVVQLVVRVNFNRLQRKYECLCIV